jgi:hypothetical protein
VSRADPVLTFSGRAVYSYEPWTGFGPILFQLTVFTIPVDITPVTVSVLVLCWVTVIPVALVAVALDDGNDVITHQVGCVCAEKTD